MSRIDELTQELCQDGVEYVDLGSVVRIRNGSDYKALGMGDVPVYGSGGVMTFVDTPVHDGPSVLIPRKGSLSNLFYVSEPFWTVDTIFYTEIDASRLIPKFFYYFMFTQRLAEKNQAGGVPSMTQSYLKRLRIPVPPLEVQREIVRVLDKFTQLEAELEAELEARRAQYSYYTTSLFGALESDGARMVSMRDLGRWYGGGTPSKNKPEYWAEGTIPWISPKDMGVPAIVGTEDYITEAAVAGSSTKLVPEHAVAIVTRSSILDHTLPVSFLTRPAAMNQDLKAVVAADGLLPRYLFHVIRGQRAEILRRVRRTGGSVASIDSKKLWEFQVPVPTLSEQERIVHFMDRFDALVNDISIGLPAELAARRKQYEYYRDRLLTFKELA